MWTVDGVHFPGPIRDLPFQASDGRPLDSRWVAEAARSVVAEDDIVVPWHVVDFYADRPDVPFANAIPAWAEAAVEEATAAEGREPIPEIRFDWRNDDLLLMRMESPEREVFVSHDNTAIVAAIPAQPADHKMYERTEVKVSYDDEFGSPEFRHEFGRDDAFFEYRCYQGSNSSMIDGVVPFVKRGGKRVARIAAHGGGLLVGTVVRLASRGAQTVKSDPLWQWNLERLESAHRDAASQIPRATRKTSSTGPTCIVLVHGTFSCGIKIARELTSLEFFVPIYRFEHDTFRPIEENARELADLVDALGARKVLLLGHSRGGLVAAAAVVHLQLRRRLVEVELWTYGTPHAGTPLVEAGSKVLGWLYRLGADLVNGVFVPPPLQAAMSYFLGTAALPPGISAMDPDGIAVTTHQSHLEYVDLTAYGGVIDPTLTEQTVAGAGFMKGLARAMFAGRDNDLVVPFDSACWKGGQPPFGDCEHGQYFRQPTVHRDIAGWS